MGDQSTNRKSFLAASEAVENTDQITADLQDETADIRYLDLGPVSIVPEVINVDRERERPSISGVKQGKIADKCTVSATIPLAGFEAAQAGQEAPAYACFLKAMGLKETITAGTSSAYSPATVQQESLSFHEYVHNVDDGNSRLQRSTGIRGGGSFNFELDAESRAEFEGIGSYYKQTDERAYFDSSGAIQLQHDGTPAPARTTGTEEFVELYGIIAKQMTCTIDTIDFELSAASLSLNWDRSERPGLTGSSKWTRTLNTKGTSGSHFALDLTFKNKAAFEKVLANFDTENLFPFHMELNDGAKRIQLDAPLIQFQAPGYEDDTNVRAYTVTAVLTGDWSGLRADNDFTLTFDAQP